MTLLVRRIEPRHSSARRLGEVLVHALELDSNVVTNEWWNSFVLRGLGRTK